MVFTFSWYLKLFWRDRRVSYILILSRTRGPIFIFSLRLMFNYYPPPRELQKWKDLQNPVEAAQSEPIMKLLICFLTRSLIYDLWQDRRLSSLALPLSLTLVFLGYLSLALISEVESADPNSHWTYGINIQLDCIKRTLSHSSTFVYVGVGGWLRARSFYRPPFCVFFLDNSTEQIMDVCGEGGTHKRARLLCLQCLFSCLPLGLRKWTMCFIFLCTTRE